MLHDYAIQNIPEAKQFRENLRYIINDNRKLKIILFKINDSLRKILFYSS